VWVAESIRTLGFGRILLQQALAAAVDMGSKRVLLEAEEDTRRHNHLVSFYLREGFTQLGDESFVKYIPHQDGCFRKVPMHLQLEVSSFSTPTCEKGPCFDASCFHAVLFLR
jgi:predicted GNAT family N-acyltransferase